MKYLLLILSLMPLTRVEIYSQSLAQEGNQWNVVSYSLNSANIRSYSIMIGEDTIVDQRQYNKVFYSNDSLNTNWEFRTKLVRQDSTKKVFLKQGSKEEYLLYDFGLNVNDTFSIENNCTLVVTAVDSVRFNNNENRKRLKLERRGDPSWGTQYWIDGVGSNFGMTSHFGFCYFDYSDEFLCFYNSEVLLYPAMPPSCFITAVKEISQQELEVFPNPTSHELVINNTENNMEKYTIYSFTGELMFKGDLDGNLNKISVSGLPQGIYTLLLEDKQNNIFSKRISILR